MAREITWEHRPPGLGLTSPRLALYGQQGWPNQTRTDSEGRFYFPQSDCGQLSTRNQPASVSLRGRSTHIRTTPESEAVSRQPYWTNLESGRKDPCPRDSGIERRVHKGFPRELPLVEIGRILSGQLKTGHRWTRIWVSVGLKGLYPLRHLAHERYRLRPQTKASGAQHGFDWTDTSQQPVPFALDCPFALRVAYIILKTAVSR